MFDRSIFGFSDNPGYYSALLAGWKPFFGWFLTPIWDPVLETVFPSLALEVDHLKGVKKDPLLRPGFGVQKVPLLIAARSDRLGPGLASPFWGWLDPPRRGSGTSVFPQIAPDFDKNGWFLTLFWPFFGQFWGGLGTGKSMENDWKS